MARWNPENDNADAVLAAADRWSERCFRTDSSLFGDESLWTLDNIRDFRRRVVDNPIEGEGTFVGKLRTQLESASPQVIQLAAELVWFLQLFPSKTKQKTKRDQIKQIWELSGSDLPNSPYISDEVLSGIGIPGQQYNRNRDPQFVFLIKSIERWKAEPRPQKTDLMTEENVPWRLAEWFDQIEGSEKRPMRNVILYFLFPDYMERCASPEHRNDILKAFENWLPDEFLENNRLSPTDVDRALYGLRKILEEEHGNKEIDFFDSPFKEQWLSDRASKPVPPSAPDDISSDSSDPAPVARQGDTALNTILYGPPGTGKTYATAKRCVEICDGEAPESNEKVRDRYRELVKEGRVEFATFHQSYGYEEFVEGLRPEPNEGGGYRLVVKDGVLKRIADRARVSDDAHILVIDEINRANISKVLGELVTLLEKDKREGAEHEIAVTLPHSGDRFTLPANLYILGTMNTADRSIALLDTALRRRFDFEEMAPDPDLLKVVEGIDLPKVLSTINDRLEWLSDRSHLIGHAWLLRARTKADVDRIMRRKIIPLIAEYFYEDWNKVRAVLGGTNHFVRRESLDRPPRIEDDRGEERYRWTIQESFADGAYERLVAGPAADGGEGDEG